MPCEAEMTRVAWKDSVVMGSTYCDGASWQETLSPAATPSQGPSLVLLGKSSLLFSRHKGPVWTSWVV